ncbi:MAG: prolyl oligopeptidase family serine peptidase [Acidobacteriaceae bacterium]
MLLLAALSALCLSAQQTGPIRGGGGITLPAPPPTEIKPVTDDLHGVKVTDDYRWLEDQDSPQTRAWINSQIKYTDDYLSQVKDRPEIVKRLTELTHIESYSTPQERKGVYFFTKRLANENQASIYMRKGLHGADERLIDATKMSADQNTSVHINDLSEDGGLMVYGIREGGADEETVKLLNTGTRQELADSLPRARYSGVFLAPGNKGLYYAKFEGKLGSAVYFHEIGSPASADKMVFGREFEGEKFGALDLISARVTENGRYLIINVGHGVPAKRVDIYVKDLRTNASQNGDAAIRPVIHGIDNRFMPHNHDDDLYVLTDNKADNYRVIRVKINDPLPEHWATIVPEGKDVISEIAIVGGKLFTTGLHDVVTETRIFTLDGKQTGTITNPVLGASSALHGRDQSQEGFYTFESFNIPPTIYRYDVATGQKDVFAKPNVPFPSDNYEVKQVFYKSKDGTRIPMFISAKKGLKQTGKTPTLMYAYGGFNLTELPHWDPEFAWWMEQGGFYAQPNLRGGGEYGETWHRAGMFEKKQNVFDDFFAAAEYLIAHKYTDSSMLATRGRSNGGLLMGVAMTQRPDLFGAIWCGYPLLDMLRYQDFLVGRWWTAEYGSAENPEQFQYLLQYSPYQNVRKGTKYPAIMFNTGDADTRVAPLHARKMTALMQRDDGSDRPVILHYELKAGHSAGVSLQQLVNDTADELAFLWNETVGRK